MMFQFACLEESVKNKLSLGLFVNSLSVLSKDYQKALIGYIVGNEIYASTYEHLKRTQNMLVFLVIVFGREFKIV